MGTEINGKVLAARYREEIKKTVEELKGQGKRVPCLSAVITGCDGGSIYYLNNVVKLCNDLGVRCIVHRLDDNVEEAEVIRLIETLNEDMNIDGIMMFLPLPGHIDEKRVTSIITYKKDIDGLTDINNGRFYKGETCFTPCTPMSVMHLIKITGIELSGKHAVVIGRSNIVGKPTAQLLLNENCTVTICHSKTTDLARVCSSADILVSAIGRPGFVNREFIKEGAVVIDVGTSSVNGKITGDVLYDEAIDKAAFVTPVPGGVGAVTTTMLIKNVCEAYMRNVY